MRRKHGGYIQRCSYWRRFTPEDETFSPVGLARFQRARQSAARDGAWFALVWARVAALLIEMRGGSIEPTISPAVAFKIETISLRTTSVIVAALVAAPGAPSLAA